LSEVVFEMLISEMADDLYKVGNFKKQKGIRMI
jgi:hypothetical protein